MKIGSFRMPAMILLCLLGNACTTADPDFCALLSLSEVLEFDADVVSSQMSMRGDTAPTRYCVYSTSKNEEVFLLSIGNPTKNTPYRILQTYLPHMEGENNVERIEGVGRLAAALFSDDYEEDRFRILIANGDDWSVTIRAKGVRDTSSDRFVVLKGLANKALTRF